MIFPTLESLQNFLDKLLLSPKVYLVSHETFLIKDVELRQDLQQSVYVFFIVNNFYCIVNCLGINHVTVYKKFFLSFMKSFSPKVVSQNSQNEAKQT